MHYSVVMSVFNGQTYLSQAIKSVLSQSYKDFEFIIVNDGSTDKTEWILEQVKDRRVRLIHALHNLGQTRALNLGIAKARGDWIIRQDADDISLPQRFARLANHIETHPEIVGVGSLFHCLPTKTNIDPGDFSTIEWTNRILSRDEIRQHRFIGPPLLHGTMAFSRRVFQDIGGYDPRYRITQDFDLIIRLLKRGPLDKIPHDLYEYRRIPNSLSRKQVKTNCIEALSVASFHIRKLLRWRLKREPQLIVVGSKNGCRFIKQSIAPANDLTICNYHMGYDVNGIDSITNQITNQRADGVIILHGTDYWAAFEALQKKGLVWNKNLFHTWCIY
jgi:glycosyltransferase involved in cell wall biosynthesis